MLDLRDINKLQIDSYITIAAINSPNIYNCYCFTKFMKILSFGVLISAMLKFNRNIQNIGFMPL